MWTKLSLALFLVGGFFVQKSSAQEIFEVRLNCSFEVYPIYTFIEYACVLRDVNFDFSNPFYYTIIEGEHEPGRTNADVRNLVILDSNTNTIPANILQVLNNVEYIQAVNSGITALGGTSFTFASTIRGLFINFNSLPNLGGSPFFTRSGITHLNLYANGIETIGNGYFNGLSGLRYLSLGGNNLVSLTPQQFAPLVNLRELLVSNNQIEALSSNLFATTRQIQLIVMENNNINAIGPNIFNGLTNLEFVALSQNTCIDADFEFGDEVNIDTVNEALQTCFDNALPEPPRTRTLLFELRGNMTLFNEYREEILSVQGRGW